MNKRLLCLLILVSLILSLTGCKPDTQDLPNPDDDTPVKRDFSQSALDHGEILFGPNTGPYNISVNNYDDIMVAFEYLRDSKTMNEFVYAFNYSGDEFDIVYDFNARIFITECDENDLLDFISNGSPLFLSTKIFLKNPGDDTVASENDRERPRISLVFDKSKLDAPKILNKNALFYSKTESWLVGTDYCYEVTYDKEHLFYVQSSFPLNNEIFYTLFIDSLVQFDGRQ